MNMANSAYKLNSVDQHWFLAIIRILNNYKAKIIKHKGELIIVPKGI